MLKKTSNFHSRTTKLCGNLVLPCSCQVVFSGRNALIQIVVGKGLINFFNSCSNYIQIYLLHWCLAQNWAIYLFLCAQGVKFHVLVCFFFTYTKGLISSAYLQFHMLKTSYLQSPQFIEVYCCLGHPLPNKKLHKINHKWVVYEMLPFKGWLSHLLFPNT